MKKTIAVLAFCVAPLVGVAPAHAKTSDHAMLVKLTKTVKKQAKTIKALQRKVSGVSDVADGATSEIIFLENCLGPVNVGLGNVLDDSTLAAFAQGTPDGSIPDSFEWLPSSLGVVQAGGPDNMLLVDPACVVTPSAAPVAKGRVAANRFGFKAVLR